MFSLKAPGFATQTTALENAAKAIKRFVFAGLAELGDRLGPISWQFAANRAFSRDYFAGFLDLLPAELNGRPLRHVLEVRHESFMSVEYLALMRERNLPSVFTDSTEYPSFADLTGDFIYARLMRSESSVATGYSADALDDWAKRAQIWANGGSRRPAPRRIIAEDCGEAARRIHVLHKRRQGTQPRRRDGADQAYWGTSRMIRVVEMMA